MKKNLLIVIAGIIILGGVSIILMAATPESSTIELNLKDLVANQKKYSDSNVTVEGFLEEDSIEWNADKIELKFTVNNAKGEELHVTYNGIKPDNFSEGVITILQGKAVGKDNQFVAEKVQTRCPSKYEGANMDDYDPETHKTKLNDVPDKN